MKHVYVILSLALITLSAHTQANTPNAQTMQLFKSIMNSERSTTENLIASAGTDINARWAVANNVTPVEIALNKAIRSAKDYSQVLTGMESRVQICKYLMLGGAATLVAGGLLSPYAFDQLSKEYAGYVAGAGIVGLAAGTMMDPASTIDGYYSSMYNKITIVKALLNANNLNLKTTHLDLNDQTTQNALTQLRACDFSKEALQQFVADVQAGNYDNLTFKARA